MYTMEQTWRWFGPADPVSLKDIKQTGATGVVTALHHIPHGQIWDIHEIGKRGRQIRKEGLTWTIVESITVHESIKTRTGDYKNYIEKYKASIRNLGASGIKVVTYNFMPVNDWTRTSLNYIMPDGSLALYFNWVDLAVFDLYILKRRNSFGAYPSTVLQEAEERFKNYSAKELDALARVVMFGIPGEKGITKSDMLQKLELYDDINADALRENLCHFQNEISPVAEECGVKLAIHPDDPPFSIFGLPRIVSTMEDFEYFLERTDSPANGVCLCSGSLGASGNNSITEMIRRINSKIHFVHLRNVRKDGEGNFHESGHLDGDNDMRAIVKELLLLQQQLRISIPFRPDHGHQMLDDMNKNVNPGYSCIGRMKGLAEIRGLELGLLDSFMK